MKRSERLSSIAWSVVAAVCIIYAGHGWAAEPAAYHVGAEKSELAGRLIQKMFYGPPGYGEDPEHDTKERVFVLKLFKPVVVRPAGKGGAADEIHDNVREMQVDNLGKVRLGDFLNKKVRIRGTLRTAGIGHDHTEVLITPDEIVPDEGRHRVK